MRKLRSVFPVLGTAIAFAISFRMLEQVIGVTSPWLWLLVMFYFLGIAKVAEPIFMLRMPALLHGIRPKERSGDLYLKLGVHRFGKLLRNTPLRYLNPSVYIPRAQGDLSKLFQQTKSAEATHFWATVLFTPYIAFLFVAGQMGIASVFLLIQLLFNVYPILHLRIVRARLELIRDRRHERSTRTNAHAGTSLNSTV